MPDASDIYFKAGKFPIQFVFMQNLPIHFNTFHIHTVLRLGKNNSQIKSVKTQKIWKYNHFHTKNHLGFIFL